MPTFDNHKDLAYSTVATAPSPATSGVTLILQTGDGANFPAAPFPYTAWPTGVQPTVSNAEIGRCTSKSGDTLTITRGSPARSIVVGDQIMAGLVAKSLTDIEAAITPVVQTTTSTGTQNDFALTADCDVLRCNNATLLTLTGFAAGFDGQRVVIVSIGAGQVDLSHQAAGSTAANRLINFATSASTSLAAGSGTAEIEYDATTARWRLIRHDQGAWIVPTYASGNFTGDVTTWTVDSADILTSAYWLKGRTLNVIFIAQSTSTGAGTNNALRVANAAWGGFTVQRDMIAPIMLNDNLAGLVTGFVQTGPALSATQLAFKKFSGTWAASTNLTAVYCNTALEVS
jgi:hypothetical protein